MAEVPPNVVADPLAELAQWDDVKRQLARLQASERILRDRLFNHFFPAPVEGTNRVDLPAGYKLVGKYPITRKVDPGALAALKAAAVHDAVGPLRAAGYTEEQISAMNPDAPVLQALLVNADVLVKYEPELVTRAYRTLTAEQAHVFDTCLVVKPGSAALEIEPPKVKQE